MSVEVMSMVFKRYPNGGGEMLLALALADHANDQGTGIYPSIASLAEKTRQSVRAVQYQLRAMEAAGWLILVNSGNGGRNQRREYRVSDLWIKGADFASLKSGAPEAGKGADIAPIASAEKGAIHDVKGATDDAKGANGDTKGCNGLHPHITVIEPSEPSRTVKGVRKRSPGFDPLSIELPEWLDADDWADWAKHRAEIRKPITEQAAREQLRRLGEFRQAGATPREVLRHCIAAGWQGLFAPAGTQAPTGGAKRFNPSEHVNRSKLHKGEVDADPYTIDG